MKLEISSLSKSFGDKLVLDGVSFECVGGSAFGFLGRNGAGKTTTLRIIMGVFGADSGSVTLDGKKLDPFRGIGYLPEERGLYPKKIIFDQLTYFARLKGMDKSAAGKAVDHWLERLGMSEYRNKRLDTLSKGNQQKIQLITALAHDPQIIILDEPFSGLDPVNAMLLKDVVREEIARGKIVIFSSHQMTYIEEFCDRIAILNHGRIALSGSLRDIKKSYPRNRLEVRSPDAAAIADRYSGGAGARLSPGGATCAERTGDDSVIIHLGSPADKKRVIAELADTFDVDSVCVVEPSLNDVFVEYASE